MVEDAADADSRWCEELAHELRRRSVTDRRVRDEVASVAAYCRESGERAAEAFGDPRDYATSLAFGAADVDRRPAGELLTEAWPTLAGLAGFSVSSWAAGGVRSGQVPIDLGRLVALLVVAAAVLVVARHLDTVVRNTAAVGATLAGTVVLAVLSSRLLDVTLVTAPVALVAVAAAGLLVASVLGQHRRHGRADVPESGPADGRDGHVSRRPGTDRVGTALGPWFWVWASVAIVVLAQAFRG